VQALGRSRAVNRTAQNPVEAFVVLDDLTLPIPVDAVEHVSDVEPNEIDEMVARGLVPEWPADAARLYPDLFKSQNAADHKYRRDGRVSAMFAATSYSANGLTSRATSYSGLGDTSGAAGAKCSTTSAAARAAAKESWPQGCRGDAAGRRGAQGRTRRAEEARRR